MNEISTWALVSWTVSVVLSTVIGGRKGELLGGFVIGLILGPLGVGVALVSSGRRRVERGV